MRPFLRSIEHAARRCVTALLALMLGGVAVWLMLGFVGLKVPLPAVELGLGLGIAYLVVNGRRPEPAPRPAPPAAPARPRRRMTPEDLIILDGMARRGQITPAQFNAAVLEALPPVTPAEPARDVSRGRR